MMKERARRMWALAFGFYILVAIITWAGYLAGFVFLQGAVKYTVITPLVLAGVYSLHRFVRTRPTLQRLIYIFFGAFCIGFFCGSSSQSLESLA